MADDWFFTFFLFFHIQLSLLLTLSDEEPLNLENKSLISEMRPVFLARFRDAGPLRWGKTDNGKIKVQGNFLKRRKKRTERPEALLEMISPLRAILYSE